MIGRNGGVVRKACEGWAWSKWRSFAEEKLGTAGFPKTPGHGFPQEVALFDKWAKGQMTKNASEVPKEEDCTSNKQKGLAQQHDREGRL
jgi:hypothetical protein